MKFNKEELKRLWSNGLKLRVGYSDFKVCKMSYGQYFLEPFNCGLSETEGFDKKTIWLINDKENKNILVSEVKK